MLFDILNLLRNTPIPLTLAQIQGQMNYTPDAVVQGVHILVGKGRVEALEGACPLCGGCQGPVCSPRMQVYRLK